MNHFSKNLENFDFFFWLPDPSNVTARAGLIVSAIRREDISVTVIMNGIENMNLPMIQVMNNIAENIHTTVRVVDIRTFL